MTPEACKPGTVVRCGSKTGRIISEPFTADTPATAEHWGNERFVRVEFPDGFGPVLVSVLQRIVQTTVGSRQVDWVATSLYCPECGKQDVWLEDGSDDYYVGESHCCVACAAVFTYQGPCGNQLEDSYRGPRIAALRESVAPRREPEQSGER